MEEDKRKEMSVQILVTGVMTAARSFARSGLVVNKINIGV
jgi:hypothetical protein